MEIKGQEAAYLMGGDQPISGSLLISSSRFLNNPRFRDVYAQMGLKRDGRDIPTTYLIPEINRAIAEETDVERIRDLLLLERRRLPEFAQWLDARFLSNWNEAAVAHCEAGTLGALIRKFLQTSGMEIDFMFRGMPEDDFTYLLKRRVQNHDIEHLLTGFDTSPVGEIALIVANAQSLSGYFEPELAGLLSLQPMFLASTSLMRVACHYPAVLPAMLEGFARGQALGRKQPKPLFMVRWEDWIDRQVSEIREAFNFEDGCAEGYWDWTHEAARG